MKKNVARVLLDFDGTITLTDTVDAILARFADKSWKEIEAKWERGKIGSRECISLQTALIRATPDELDAYVDEIPIDPAFSSLLACGDRIGMQVLIVSDGYDRCVRNVLTRSKIDCAFKASALISQNTDGWRVESPHEHSGCRSLASTCKCRISEQHSIPTILIGDGRSDFCIANSADIVLAKGKLARHCEKKEIPYVPISNLSDAVEFFESNFGRSSQKIFTERPSALHA